MNWWPDDFIFFSQLLQISPLRCSADTHTLKMCHIGNNKYKNTNSTYFKPAMYEDCEQRQI